mmetsp:Transcript_10991/g.32709  ORF Transcript_10991/g.32709 Transcript_10991/m.32709 type:complete len:95 (-) Transcript_10991:1711-1995(-)
MRQAVTTTIADARAPLHRPLSAAPFRNLYGAAMQGGRFPGHGHAAAGSDPVGARDGALLARPQRFETRRPPSATVAATSGWDPFAHRAPMHRGK